MENRSKNVIIMGYYGSNLGDLAMLKALLIFLANQNIRSKVFSYADMPESLKGEFETLSITPIKHGGRIRGLLHFIKGVLWADAIIWGGGTCFMDEGGEGGIKYMVIAKLLLRKIFYVGIGIGQTRKKSTQRLIKLALWISTRIIVRDPESAHKIHSGPTEKIIIAPDLIYGLSTTIAEEFTSPPIKSSLLIAYRNVSEYFGSDANKRYLSEFIERVRELCEDRNITSIQIINADNDIDSNDSKVILEQLAQMLPIQHLQTTSLTEKIRAISRAETILTGRLHVAVLSHMLGREFLLLNYSPKNEYFSKESETENKLIEFTELHMQNILFKKLSGKSATPIISTKNDTTLNVVLIKDLKNYI